MAYIHVKTVGKKKYYTLRISIRDGNKVIAKDMANLGSDLSKINIDKLPSKYKNEIRKSYRTIKKFLDRNIFLEKIKAKKIKTSKHLTNEQLYDVEACRYHYIKDFQKRHKLTQKEIYESFLINFAVNSTSIEGNTITLKQANKLLRENILPKNKTLREVYDLTNTKKVFENLMESKPKLTVKLIIKIHDDLLDEIDMRKGLRNDDIHIYGQPFKPSPKIYVKSDLQMLIDWYNDKKTILHPLLLAILFHHKFEQIHPFSDGNGRTGRMLLNHILILNGYPPLVISRRHREKYLDVLNRADKALKKNLLEINSNYDELIKYISKEQSDSYWDIFL